MAKEIGSLSIKVGMDSNNFQKGVTGINREMKKVQSEFKLANSSLAKHGNELDKLKLKSDLFSKKVELQKRVINELEEAHKKSAEVKGVDARATENLAIKLNNARSKLNYMEKDLKDINQNIDKQCSKWNKLSLKLDNVGNKFKSVGSKLSSVGGELNAKVTLPLLAVGAGMTKLSFDFEEGSNKISTIANTNVLSMEKINSGILALSDDTGIATSELNESMYQTISATNDTANALGSIQVASEAAIGGFTDTTVAVDGLTTVTNAYGLKGTAAMRKVSDEMLTAQNFGKTTFGAMANDIGDVIPLAASLDVSTKDLFASIATLTKNGIKTNKSITGLKAAYSNILKPTKDATKMAEELGIEFNEAHLKSVGWAKFISEIGEKTGGNTEQMAKLFGSVEALNSVTVLATTGSKDFATALDAMEQSAGATEKAFKKMDQGGKDNFEDTINSAKNLGIEIGQMLMPVVNDAISTVGDWIQSFKDLDDGTKENIIKIGAMAAAIGPLLIVGGKLASGVGSIVKLGSLLSSSFTAASGVMAGASGSVGLLGTAFTVLTGPVGIAIAGIAAVTAVGVGLYKHFSQDSIPAVKLFGSEISKSTQEAVGGFLKLNQEATLSLDQLAWSGKAVTSDMADKISSNFVRMSEGIKIGLDKMKEESINTLQNFINNSVTLNQEEQKQILDNVSQTYDNKKQIVADGEARVKEIMSLAAEEKRAITTAERDEINKIQNTMVDEGIRVLSENEIEAKAIMERMKAQASELTAQQSAEVVRNSLEQKEGAIEAAQQQYTEVIKEIIKQRDESGSISRDQADKLILEATRQKDEAIKQAGLMHKNVISEAKKQAGEHVKQVDWETGQVKSKWEVMTANVSAKVTEMKDDVVEEWEFISTSTKKAWNNIGNSISTSAEKMSNVVFTKANKMKTDMTNSWNKVQDYLSKIDLKEIGSNIIEGLINGIKEKWTGLKETVGNLGESIKTGFTKLLDIHSPSRVFHGYGENIVQGLDNGINNLKPQVEATMKDLASMTKTYMSDTINSLRKTQEARANLAAMMTGGAGGDAVLPSGDMTGAYYYGRPDKETGYSGGIKPGVNYVMKSYEKDVSRYIDDNGDFDIKAFKKLVERLTRMDWSDISVNTIEGIAKQIVPQYNGESAGYGREFKDWFSAQSSRLLNAQKNSTNNTSNNNTSNNSNSSNTIDLNKESISKIGKDISTDLKNIESVTNNYIGKIKSLVISEMSNISENIKNNLNMIISETESSMINLDNIVINKVLLMKENIGIQWLDFVENSKDSLKLFSDMIFENVDGVIVKVDDLILKVEEWNGLNVKTKTFNIIEKVTRFNEIKVPKNVIGNLGSKLIRTTDPKDKEVNRKSNNDKGITQHINIYSPKPLSPADTARKIKNASRQLALEL